MAQISADSTSPLFDKTNMLYKEFPSDYRQVRYFALVIVQMTEPGTPDVSLLQQQITELLRNAIKHGNQLDPEKTVEVWYRFTESEARLIVKDQGPGFQDLERWNEFHEKRNHCLEEGDFEALAEFVSFKGDHSDAEDGGNALFAAVEYWDGGLVFSDERNAVAVKKTFAKPKYGRRM